MSFSSIRETKAEIESSEDIYKKIDILIQSNSLCIRVEPVHGLSSEQVLRIFPRRSQWKNLTNEEKDELGSDWPTLDFLPGYENFYEKIRCLEAMGVNVE